MFKIPDRNQITGHFKVMRLSRPVAIGSRVSRKTVNSVGRGQPIHRWYRLRSRDWKHNTNSSALCIAPPMHFQCALLTLPV